MELIITVKTEADILDSDANDAAAAVRETLEVYGYKAEISWEAK